MKSTKKSLLLSTLSLMMCVAMLLGTTYAWFTDSVTSGKNKIIAGNLDVELYANGTKVDGDTKLFSKVALWEPGAVAFDTLQVKNVGNLALKYQLSFLFENETKVDGHGLSEVLKIGTYEGEITDSTKREDVIAGLSDVAPIASFAKNGNLAANTDDTAVTYVVYWEPGDNDNLYNMNNEKKGKELSIDFYVKLVATQDTVEADSFDKFYDAGAPWFGGVDAEGLAENTDTENKTIKIQSAEQLAAFAESVNGGKPYSGYTVTLVDNIDLNNVPWTPIGAFNASDCGGDPSFDGIFDGNGKTISNLVIGKEYANTNGVGFFASNAVYDNIEIKDLTIDTATVYGNKWVGVISGYMNGASIKNCTVKNATVYCTEKRAGAIVGFAANNAVISGNAAENVKVIAPAVDEPHNVCVGTYMGDNAATYLDTNTSDSESGVLAKVSDGLLKDDAKKTYYVSNAAGMMTVRSKLADGSISKDDTVKLDADIDMTGKTWTSVECHADAKQKGFKEFDGQGYTVSNLTINGQGLFSRVATDHPITIKNVTFDNAKNNTSTLNVSLVTSQVYTDLTLDNVKVVNSEFKGTYKVAPLVATVYNEKDSTVTLTVKDCTVENCTVEGTSFNFDVCGMVAWVNTANNDRVVFEGNNTVKDVQLIKRADDAYNMYAKIWHDGGTAHDTDPNVTVTNVNIVTP